VAISNLRHIYWHYKPINLLNALTFNCNNTSVKSKHCKIKSISKLST